MAKVILYIATSLDGYIARPDGNLDWLYKVESKETDYGYGELLKQISTIVMGRATYDEVIGFGIDWPYSDFNTYIVSNDLELPIKSPKTQVASGNIAEWIQQLKQGENKDIWLIGGGKLITYFLNHDLIDKMIISVIPTIIGDGVRLFPNNPKESTWKLVDCEKFNTGVVNLSYERRL